LEDGKESVEALLEHEGVASELVVAHEARPLEQSSDKDHIHHHLADLQVAVTVLAEVLLFEFQ
jgi:hypothetical protein